MKITGLVTIETGSTDSAKAEAFKADVANVYVTTENPQTAPELLRKGIDQAMAACASWEPVRASDGDSVREDTTEEEPAYIDTPQGKRFLRSIEKAQAFTDAKDAGRWLSIDQLQYLSRLEHERTWDGILAAYNLAFRRGYNRAKADVKAKAKK